jgi:uncharacterized protein YdaU (DUF1376 family)
MNFYPFHIGDYLSHTSHLSDEEDLAYRRMIDLYYQTEEPFTDTAKLARKVRSSFEIVGNLLHEFFVYEENAWHNKRADAEIAKYKAMKDGGRKGAAMRWHKPSDSPPIALPNATPMPTKNQEPRTKNHIKAISPIGFDLFWNAYNKKIGKPNSLKQWAKIKPDDELLKLIVSKALADASAKPDNKFRKDPERWLKGQHWLDEIIVSHETSKELPLGNDQQIEAAYRAECGDPAKSRFNSYYEMRAYIIAQREKRKAA